ncbi:MAG: YD repeat-containing protein [Ferruginibacter sp.]
MTTRILMATGVAAMLVFSSCKKDKPGNPTPNNPDNVTKKLKKVTKTEEEIVTVYNLSYDAANRLQSYKSADNSEYIQFSYDAAGNLKAVEEREDNEFKKIYNYTYQNNIPVSATFKNWELTAGEPDALVEDDKLTYTVTNNQVTKIKLEMLQAEATVDLNLTYSNGNLSKVVTEGANIYTANFTFGNKKPVYPKVTNWVLDQAGFSLMFASKNELLSASFDFPGTEADENTVTVYTYDGNGYVLTSNDGVTKMVFEYE